MNGKYKQLSYKERVQIETLIKEGLRIREIARRLERSPSSISREVRNYRGGPKIKSYEANHAQRLSVAIRWQTGQKNRRKNGDVLDYVKKGLYRDWTPEQISNRIKIDQPGWSISVETIYQYVTDHGLEHLLPGRRSRKKRQKTKGKKREMIPNRVGIEHRCDKANAREEPGHLEIDAVVSKHNSVSLNVIVDRMMRLTQISKLQNMKPVTTEQAVVERLKEHPQGYCKTLTYDNGIENKNHVAINEELKTRSYFCNPYHSWEKGTVENTNGLIRRYFPKGTDFSKVPAEKIKWVEGRLNNRPRKCLGYLTPNEVYQKSITNLGCCS